VHFRNEARANAITKIRLEVTGSAENGALLFSRKKRIFMIKFLKF